MSSRATTGTVALRAACKEYGGRRVVSDLSITVAPGRIHALIGENGAGKSTALSMLAGLVSPDGGSVVIDDRPVTLRGRMAAIAAGIGLVPQHLSLVAELTLVENLALTHPHQVVRRGQLRASLSAAAAAADLSIRPDVPVARLSFAERQLGELAIALAQGARTLLLDEPTSSIGPYETGRLFERLRAAAADGAAILVVTHRIDEVRRYADDVTVLSLGTMRLQAQTATVDDATLVRAMVGHIPENAPRRRQRQTAAPRLCLESVDVRADAGLTGRLRAVALWVEPGEILGILGVAGSGQRLLAQIAAGVRRPDAGTVMVDSNEMTGDPAKARRLGLAYVPEERRNAFLPAAPLSHSSLLGRRIDAPEFVRRGMLRWDRIAAYARELIARHDVRPPDPAMAAEAFSGGNQQKFLVGRELDGAPSVVVLHSPTQGLDVHAAAAIRNAVRSAADRGAAVLLISADVDEVLELSDRVAVLSQGQIVDVFPVQEYDRDRVGRAMAGLANA